MYLPEEELDSVLVSVSALNALAQMSPTFTQDFNEAVNFVFQRGIERGKITPLQFCEIEFCAVYHALNATILNPSKTAFDSINGSHLGNESLDKHFSFGLDKTGERFVSFIPNKISHKKWRLQNATNPNVIFDVVNSALNDCALSEGSVGISQPFKECLLSHYFALRAELNDRFGSELDHRLKNIRSLIDVPQVTGSLPPDIVSFLKGDTSPCRIGLAQTPFRGFKCSTFYITYNNQNGHPKKTEVGIYTEADESDIKKVSILRPAPDSFFKNDQKHMEVSEVLIPKESINDFIFDSSNEFEGEFVISDSYPINYSALCRLMSLTNDVNLSLTSPEGLRVVPFAFGITNCRIGSELDGQLVDKMLSSIEPVGSREFAAQAVSLIKAISSAYPQFSSEQQTITMNNMLNYRFMFSGSNLGLDDSFWEDYGKALSGDLANTLNTMLDDEQPMVNEETSSFTAMSKMTI